MVDMVESSFPFGIEGEGDHCAISISPLPSFGWQQVDIYMGQHLRFGHIVVLRKGKE